MTTRQLGFPLRSRRTDPPSSSRAAEKARPRAGSLAAEILVFIEQHPGHEARAIAHAVNRPAYEVRKRTADLRRWQFAHSHAGGYGMGELTWWPGQECQRCKEGEPKR